MRLLHLAGLTLALCAAPLRAAPGYQTPAADLAAIVDAPLTPLVSPSPDRTTLLVLARADAPGIDELSRPELRLAGLRIDPVLNGPSRGADSNGLALLTVADGVTRPVAGLPEGVRIPEIAWSPDGRHVAFSVARPNGLELWVLDVAAGTARALTAPVLNAVLGEPFAWVGNAQLIIRRVPADRAAAPAEPSVPSGPTIQENRGAKAPAPTYQDLLANPHDEALFTHYATSSLALVALDGRATPLPVHGLIDNVSPSPDGRLLLVETLHPPFSYLVPSARFPRTIEVLDLAGKPLHRVAELPLAENVPLARGSVRTGPRAVSWRADRPATLSWVEALDGGDASRTAEWRDAWFTQDAPFTTPPHELQRFGYRVTGLTWGDDALALVTESWWKTRRLRTWLVAPGQPGTAPILVSERSSEDRYADPGSPITTRNAQGRSVLLRSADGSQLYFSGLGASPEGDRPFLDAFTIATRQTTRLWRSEAPHYEEFVAFADTAQRTALTRRESVEEPANYVVRTLATGELRPLTRFPHPYPSFKSVKKELLRYQRDDGVALSGTLYLPPGYTPDQGPLPTLLWAYPQEFKTVEAASQIKDSPYRFIRVSASGPLPYLLAGYAILDGPTMPIVGVGDQEPNDTYIKQLVASAKAAVDELVRRGVTDPRRVAVAGHSYGAFMTANLLAHSDLFRAGIARSGAYNRTLTPFGFQAEDRTFWQAPEVYSAMSPFNYADKVKDPLLLIHGEADNNTGTFPIQSERFYAALKGHGATTRLVLLPHEAHGYRARETLLHVLWETQTWLDTYVKPLPADAKR